MDSDWCEVCVWHGFFFFFLPYADVGPGFFPHFSSPLSVKKKKGKKKKIKEVYVVFSFLK